MDLSIGVLSLGKKTVFLNIESGSWISVNDKDLHFVESLVFSESGLSRDMSNRQVSLAKDIHRSRLLEGYSQNRECRKLAEHGRVRLVIIEVSQFCNLACTYCFEDNPTKGKLMESSTAENIVDEICKLPLSENVVIEFNGGEALINWKVMRSTMLSIMRKVREGLLKCNPVYTLQTSGTVMPDDAVDFFAANNISIGISLDGPKEIHDCRRPLANGGGSYEKIIKNIAKLKKGGVDFGLLAIVDSAAQLKEAYQHLRDLGPNALRINLQRVNGRSTTHISDEELRNIADAHIECMYDDLDRMKKGEKPMRLADICSLIENICLEEKPYMCQRSPCGAGTEQVVFDWKGDVWPCQEFIGENLFNASSKVVEEVVVKIIDPAANQDENNNTRSALTLLEESPSAAIFKERDVESIDGCNSCPVRAFCQSGCSATALYSVKDEKNRTMLAKTPHCQYYFRIIPQLLDAVVNRTSEIYKYVFCPERGYFLKDIPQPNKALHSDNFSATLQNCR